ncbi:hypothetical protein Tco_0578396 [Tanacetum coccineum]
MPTESSTHAESPSMDAELNLTNSETESDVEVSKINAGSQDEGQAGPNHGTLDEGHAGSNPGDTAGSQPPLSHVVHAEPNLEHMDLETTDASTQHKPEQMDEGFTTTAYPNVQENLKLPTEDQFFVEKPHEENSRKTNAETEVQSMVSVPIHQDTSSVPPMTTQVIDLTTMQSDSPLPTSIATTSIIITTTTIPLTPQPQQSTTDPILVRRIGEVEQHMVDLAQDNLALGERLDKHGTRLYNLENLDIPHKVSQAIDEIVTNAVDWVMQAPLRAHFRDLPTLPPPAGASGVPGTSGASGSSQLPPPPPPPSTGTFGSTPQQGREAPRPQELSPSDDLMHDDFALDEQVQVSDDQDFGNDHTPAAADSRKDWWKPIPKEERPMTPEPAWTIPFSHKSDVENN